MSDALSAELLYQQALLEQDRARIQERRAAELASIQNNFAREVAKFEQAREEATRQNQPDRVRGCLDEIQKVVELSEHLEASMQRSCDQQLQTVERAQRDLAEQSQRFNEKQNQLVEQTRHLEVAEAARQLAALREQQRLELEARMRENTRSLGR